MPETLIPGRFAGQTAIVTGGAAGIGLAVAARITAEGGRVSLWDRDKARLEEALREIGAADIQAIDIADPEAVARAAEASAAALGGTDILVCSAGITGPNTPLADYPVADWQQVINVNLNGLFYCNKFVVPQMLAGGYGRIVNIASVAGKEGNPNASAYSTSKAGVIGLTKSLGKELAKTEIPGQLRHPSGRPHRDLRSDEPDAYRLHAVENPHRPLWRGRGSNLSGLLACQLGSLLQHRRGFRHLGRSRHLLIGPS